jgi:predicted signal transduction protein with EAL and GGDEF domain
MRSTDQFGRFGGEEFSFLMAGCGPEDARLRAEQLRLTIAGLSYNNGTANSMAGTKVSASFGVASTVASGYDLRLLLAHADSALYAAKRAGRNRVAVYDTNVSLIGTGTTGNHPAIDPIAESPPEAAAGETQMTDAQILGIAGR